MTSPLTLPMTDYGGDGPVLLALHGHFGSARTFAGLARALHGQVRVVALDQRGHGLMPSDGPFSRDAYVADVANFLSTTRLRPSAVLGHSMGGVNAFQLAARHPELVPALIVEEGSAVVEPPVLDIRGWPRRADTLPELGSLIQAQGIPDPSYFLESAVRYPDGWGLACEPEAMMRSQELLLGEWWTDWAGIQCPTLLIRGADSTVLSAQQAHDMVRRRPGTEYAEFSGCGHWVHDDDVTGMANSVAEFLAKIKNRSDVPIVDSVDRR
ncbi:alpha/beta fold hydrolase [Phytoactinopolyspora limicola]|uniref:alpha/beta fold hydrolase n=1 Tax=Phytoactinopolyspora limicola TaxID=2715536 RepID=UPI00140ADEE1|nr:alpha/beta hydrolase [Phytoactinopolyspora limicola]